MSMRSMVISSIRWLDVFRFLHFRAAIVVNPGDIWDCYCPADAEPDKFDQHFYCWLTFIR